ncbi:MAG TPA: polysaccharide deacetylase family protein [Rhizobiaceae bacterium]|nr:polysaccharide deacetylase family protein [Rhizobiaceae bacterium]
MNPDIALAQELESWRAAGKLPRLFLRDDDAIADTPALRRLFKACEKAGAPLLLASIPAHADASLGAAVRGFALAKSAVHGYAHTNHAPKGEKPCELGRHRPINTVIGELKAGREKLLELFGGKLSAILVPPWNRIHDEVAARVHEAGFNGISAHGWLSAPPPHTLAVINAHIDIIHWSGGRTGRNWPWLAGELEKALREARLRGWRAVGILTHHLAHDDAAWLALDRIAGFAAANGMIWVAADSLLEEPTEAPAPLGQA